MKKKEYLKNKFSVRIKGASGNPCWIPGGFGYKPQEKIANLL
jgi:hypothetical protein